MKQFSASEKKFIRKFKSPEDIQNFLNSIPYNKKDTAYSPRQVMQYNTAHCLEGAVFAAAVLEEMGHEPLLLDLEAEYDSDHVLALFKRKGFWGSIGSSNFSGLRYRPPVYASIRELALSYFNDYFNMRKQRTLRRYSSAVNLKRFDKLNWKLREDNIWFIAEYLCEIPHKEIASAAYLRSLPGVDERAFQAGKLGMIKK